MGRNHQCIVHQTPSHSLTTICKMSSPSTHKGRRLRRHLSCKMWRKVKKKCNGWACQKIKTLGSENHLKRSDRVDLNHMSPLSNLQSINTILKHIYERLRLSLTPQCQQMLSRLGGQILPLYCRIQWHGHWLVKNAYPSLMPALLKGLKDQPLY